MDSRSLRQSSPNSLSGSLCRLRSLLPLRANCEQFQQHGVAFAFELFNRAVAGLLLYAFDNRFLDLGAEFSDFPEVFPPGGEWARELVHEMLNASLTATEMEQEIGSHYTPTQPRPPAHGSV